MCGAKYAAWYADVDLNEFGGPNGPARPYFLNEVALVLHLQLDSSAHSLTEIKLLTCLISSGDKVCW